MTGEIGSVCIAYNYVCLVWSGFEYNIIYFKCQTSNFKHETFYYMFFLFG